MCQSNPRVRCQNGNAGGFAGLPSPVLGVRPVVSQPNHGLQRSPKVRPGRCCRTRGHDPTRLAVRVRRAGIGILPVPSAVEGSKSAAADAPKGPNPVRIAIPGKGSASRGLALTRLFSSSNVTSQSTTAPRPCSSDRNNPETGIAVTPTKQTTAVLSNRNKKTPPGEWLSGYPWPDRGAQPSPSKAGRRRKPPLLVGLVTGKKFCRKTVFQGRQPGTDCSRATQLMWWGEGLVDVAGIEPATPCLQSRCSPS